MHSFVKNYNLHGRYGHRRLDLHCASSYVSNSMKFRITVSYAKPRERLPNA